MKTLVDLDAFFRRLCGAFGTALEEPQPARLGYVDENGTQHLRVSAGEYRGGYYFTFGDDPDSSLWAIAYNAGPGALSEDKLRARAPVWIAKESQTAAYCISGIRAREGTEFFRDSSSPPQQVQLRQFTPGLIDETRPASMRVMVYGAPYRLDHAFRYWGTRQSTSLTSLIPASAGIAVCVLVQINFDTGVLSTVAGAEFDSTLTNEQIAELDNGTHAYLPRAVDRCFACGYVRLTSGTTAIRRVTNIWALQEIYRGADYSDILVAGDEIVTLDGSVLYA